MMKVLPIPSTTNGRQTSNSKRINPIFAITQNIEDPNEASVQPKSSLLHSLLIVPILIIVTLANIDFALIPNGYTILSTDIRLAHIFNTVVGNGFGIANHYFDYLFIMGENKGNSGKYLIAQYLIQLFVKESILFVLDTFFINGLSFNTKLGLAVNAATLSIQFFIWMYHPKPERFDPKFLKRFLWFMLFRMVQIFFVQAYYQSIRLYDTFNYWLQPLLVFLLLGMRYAMTKCVGKIVEKARGDNANATKFLVNCRVGCVHALFVMLVVGSKANIATTSTLILFDTVLLARLWYQTLKSVRLDQNTGNSNLLRLIQGVVLRETLEILLPICFMVIKRLAFHGPNKETLDLVRDKTEEDLTITQQKIGALMIFDGIRILTLAIFLKKKYEISLFQGYTDLMKNYWGAIASFATITIFIVSCFTLLHGNYHCRYLNKVNFSNHNTYIIIIILQYLKTVWEG